MISSTSEKIPFFVDEPKAGTKPAKENLKKGEGNEFLDHLSTKIAEKDDSKESAKTAKAEGGKVPENPKKADLNSNENRQTNIRIDKPKVGNKEPFFPKNPMPFHPELNRTPLNPNQGNQNVEVAENDFVPMVEVIDVGDLDVPAPLFDVPVQNPEVQSEGTEDTEGIASAGYDYSSVSYPMAQIAPNFELPKSTLDQSAVTPNFLMPNQLQVKDQGEVKAVETPKAEILAVPSKAMLSLAAVIKEVQGDPQSQAGLPLKSAPPVAEPIRQFVASLENELDVKPDVLVKAFERLQPQQLNQAPGKGMVDVIRNLGLPQGQEKRAEELLEKMLKDLKIDSKDTNSLMANQNPAAVIPAVAIPLVAQNVVEPEGSKPVDLKGYKSTKAQKLFGEQATTKGNPMKLNSEIQVSTLLPSENNSTETDLASKSVDVFKSSNDALTSSDLNLPKGTEVSDKSSMADVSMKGSINSAQTGKPVELPTLKTLNEKSKLKDPNFKIQEVKVEALETPKEAFAKDSLTPLAPIADAGKPAELPPISNAQSVNRVQAVQNILDQTQILAQRGGGEMKMTLHPDTLGQVQLKVATEGNRVEIQMIADKPEAKKLIESQISELKHGLSQHNLSTEKINVSLNDKGASMEMNQGRPQFGSGMEFAQQSRQQSNQQRESQQFFDGFNNRASFKPNPGRAPSAVRMGSSSGRLNLVA